MKYYLFTVISIMLLILSCKTSSFVGEYKSCQNNCITIIIKIDSTYIETISPEIGDKYELLGRWQNEGGYLYLRPNIEPSTQYDSARKEYYTYVDGIRVPVNKDYSIKKFKILKNKLNLILATNNGQQKSSPCAFVKMPLNKIEREKLIRKNRNDCQ